MHFVFILVNIEIDDAQEGNERKNWSAQDYLDMDSDNELSDNQVSKQTVISQYFKATT